MCVRARTHTASMCVYFGEGASSVARLMQSGSLWSTPLEQFPSIVHVGFLILTVNSNHLGS